MTRIEKNTVLAALSEYAYRHQKAAEKAHKRGEYGAEREERGQAGIACAIMAYWVEIVNAPCGETKI